MKIIKKKHRRGRPKIQYSNSEEKFYKQNKQRIIEGLKNDVPKTKIKSIFFAAADEIKANNPELSKRESMNKVLRSSTFTSSSERYEQHKQDVLEKYIKGQKKNIKKYLGLSQNKRLNIDKLEEIASGWKYSDNNKNILLKRNEDTKTEGYVIIYE